jgi:hypothetical protein
VSEDREGGWEGVKQGKSKKPDQGHGKSDLHAQGHEEQDDNDADDTYGNGAQGFNLSLKN